MADKPKVKPSSAGVWIGLVMMLLSFASCGAGCVLAGSEIKDAADAAQRVDVPASQTYDMEADAAGIIIGLAPSASDAKGIEFSLTDENGTAFDVSTSAGFSSSARNRSRRSRRWSLPLNHLATNSRICSGAKSAIST